MEMSLSFLEVGSGLKLVSETTSLGKYVDEFIRDNRGCVGAKKAYQGGNGSFDNNALLRGDDALYTNVRTNGISKSYIDVNGNLIPANPNGIYNGRQVSVTEHILGGYRRGAKGNSPYTSFTFNDSIIQGYGNSHIEVNISGLRKAIQSGEVTDVAILSPKQIEKLIINDITQSIYWKNKALSWTRRDSEYLIKGIIPKEFIKIIK